MRVHRRSDMRSLRNVMCAFGARCTLGVRALHPSGTPEKFSKIYAGTIEKSFSIVYT